MQLMPQGSPADAGLQSQGDITNPQVDAQGVGPLAQNSFLDGLGASMQSAVNNGPTADLFRDKDLYGLDNDGGPTLTADQANAKYGIKGTLNFDRSVTESGAKYRYDDALYNQQLQERIAGTSGMGSAVGNTVASFIGGMSDPMNIAASFIPVLGEERAAAMLGKAGLQEGAIKTAAGRFLQGSAGATVGALALTPITAISQEYATGQAYTPGEAAGDLLLNAAIGGALHTSFGMIGDAGKWLFNSENAEKNGLFSKAAAAVQGVFGPDTEAGMKRAASGALFDGENPLAPSDVAEADLNVAKLQAESDVPLPEVARQPADYSEVLQHINDTNVEVTPYDPQWKKPVTADWSARGFVDNPQVERLTNALDNLDKVGDITGEPNARQARQIAAISRSIEPMDVEGGLALASQEAEKISQNASMPIEERKIALDRVKKFAADVAEIPNKIPLASRGSREVRQRAVTDRVAQLQRASMDKAKAKVSGTPQTKENTATADEATRERQTGVTPPEPDNLSLDTAAHLSDEEDLSKFADQEAERIDPEGMKEYDALQAKTAEGEQMKRQQTVFDNIKQLYKAATNCVIGE